jgi:5-methylcytosine-specific restriction endonuclease McrA
MAKGIKGFVSGHKHSEETKKKIGDANRNQIYFNCEYCGKQSSDKPSHYKLKKRHFCSMKCYSKFRKELLPFYEQHAYKGIRKEGETKQIYHRNYCKNNPENISHLKARRYARERKAEGSHTLQQWKDLKEKHGNKCVSCGLKKTLTKDHIVPLSKGGTDYIENIQPLCKNCNSKKHNKI